MDSAQIATSELGELLISATNGSTPHRSDASLYADDGIKFLRILNIDDGEIVERDIKHITAAVHNGALNRSRLAADDVLITITGRVGSAAVVRESHLPANINDHIVRMRIDAKRCLPDFLSEWLNCPTGLELSNRGASGATRLGLDYSAIRSIRIPLPASLEMQDGLVQDMRAARAVRKAMLNEADTLLAGIDTFVMETLGITPPALRDSRNVFAVRGKSLLNRFDPYFHSPHFAQIEQMLSQKQCETLGEISNFSKEIWKPQDHDQPTFRYIEISDVNPETGEAGQSDVPTLKAPSRAQMRIRTNDIIVSLTRPHHGSIAHLGAEFEGAIASTGFAVIRDVTERVSREYLSYILRAQFCLDQMIQRASGGSYPAISKTELAKVIIPVPNKRIQRHIVAEIRRRRQKARSLRGQADVVLRDAKRRFEAQLLGGVGNC